MLFNIANTMIEMDEDTTAQILRNGTDTHKNKVKEKMSNATRKVTLSISMNSGFWNWNVIHTNDRF